MIVLQLWLGLVGCFWTLAFVAAVSATRRDAYRVGRDDPATSSDCLVSIVIPARDEAHQIEHALRSVLGQDHHHIEVIVLDDGSTDGTAEVVQGVSDPRVQLVEGGADPLPEGWLGKPWACYRAAQKARGDWLLFMDADVRLSPEALSRSLAYCEAHQLRALSGLGTLEMQTFGEHLMQPVIAGLLLAGNALKDVNDPDKVDKALANGQYILLRRDTWEQLGGHEVVRDNVLDDVGLAIALKAARIPYHLVFMRELFSCRMYDSGAAVWRGWRKNLFPGMGWSWSALAALLTGHSLGFLLPYAVMLLGVVGWVPLQVALVACFPILAIQGLRAFMDQRFNQGVIFGQLTHALANFLLFFLLVDSAISTTLGRATWKGRVLPKRTKA